MELNTEIAGLAREFEVCRKVLIALGDENRQQLIMQMMQMGECTGVRVVDIAERSHLSRPAVSHHLQIMKDAGLVKMRREGTRTFYYFDADVSAMNGLIGMLEHARSIMQELPDRSGNTTKTAGI